MHRFSRSFGEWDKKRCFKANNEFRDVRLSTDAKVKDLQHFITLIAEYKIQNPKSNLSELKLGHDVKSVQSFISNYTQYDPKLKYAFISGMHGRFLSSQNGTGPMTTGERPIPLGWEVFAIEERGNGKIAIKSCGKYVSSENGERDLRCNRADIGARELFEIFDHGNGIYSFKGSNGKYISSSAEEQTLSCISGEVSDNEKFYVQWMNDLVDEINISWSYYDQFFTKLCAEYDTALEGKRNVNSEKYFITNNVEVYHEDSGSFAQCHQQIFNQTDYKEALQKFDRKIAEIVSKVDGETNFLNSILWGEKNNYNRIKMMMDDLAPAYVLLGGKPTTQIPKPTDSEQEEEDADDYDLEEDSDDDNMY